MYILWEYDTNKTAIIFYEVYDFNWQDLQVTAHYKAIKRIKVSAQDTSSQYREQSACIAQDCLTDKYGVLLGLFGTDTYYKAFNDECWYWIYDHQGQSWDYSLKYNGYSVEEFQ